MIASLRPEFTAEAAKIQLNLSFLIQSENRGNDEGKTSLVNTPLDFRAC